MHFRSQYINDSLKNNGSSNFTDTIVGCMNVVNDLVLERADTDTEVLGTTPLAITTYFESGNFELNDIQKQKYMETCTTSFMERLNNTNRKGVLKIINKHLSTPLGYQEFLNKLILTDKFIDRDGNINYHGYIQDGYLYHGFTFSTMSDKIDNIYYIDPTMLAFDTMLKETGEYTAGDEVIQYQLQRLTFGEEGLMGNIWKGFVTMITKIINWIRDKLRKLFDFFRKIVNWIVTQVKKLFGVGNKNTAPTNDDKEEKPISSKTVPPEVKEKVDERMEKLYTFFHNTQVESISMDDFKTIVDNAHLIANAYFSFINEIQKHGESIDPNDRYQAQGQFREKGLTSRALDYLSEEDKAKFPKWFIDSLMSGKLPQWQKFTYNQLIPKDDYLENEEHWDVDGIETIYKKLARLSQNDLEVLGKQSQRLLEELLDLQRQIIDITKNSNYNYRKPVEVRNASGSHISFNERFDIGVAFKSMRASLEIIATLIIKNLSIRIKFYNDILREFESIVGECIKSKKRVMIDIAKLSDEFNNYFGSIKPFDHVEEYPCYKLSDLYRFMTEYAGQDATSLSRDIQDVNAAACYSTGRAVLMIYICDGAIQKLTKNELEAMKYHEYGHIIHHDGLRKFEKIFQAADNGIAFARATRRMLYGGFYRPLKDEINADKTAMEYTGIDNTLAFLKSTKKAAGIGDEKHIPVKWRNDLNIRIDFFEKLKREGKE